MRILVLGATGFLGRHATGSLRALPGAQVLEAGRRRPGGGPLPGEAPEAPFDVPLDLATADPERFATVLRAAAPDAVVNCAGAVGGSALALTATNARGPAALCEALRETVPRARLVHLGSAAEYGACDGRAPLAESGTTRPVGLYGAAKLAGTLAVTGSGLDATVLRVFNPVGPGAPDGSLPGRLARELRRAGPDGRVRVGDLSAHRDFVDARDVADAVVRAVTAPGPVPPVLNIGSGTARPSRAVAEELVRAAGFRGTLDEDGDGSHRSAAVPWQQADITLATRTLGWLPRRTLTESLTDLWHDTARTPESAR
ncbi:NarL family transcriptional regulator [Streptomyces griseocarneus]|nr:NarL family transcriptional regulator [Streptomyces griseocarneus]